MFMKKLMTVVVSALCAAVAFGADYYVDYANGVDEEGRGSSDAPFKTIAYAIGRTDVEGHDVIHLMKGGHGVSEKLTLDHAVDLVGATDNPADTRVYRTKEPSASGMLDITAEGCFITGIDFDNSKKSVYMDYVLKVQHGTVSNCVIRGNSSWPGNGTAASAALQRSGTRSSGITSTLRTRRSPSSRTGTRRPSPTPARVRSRAARGTSAPIRASSPAARLATTSSIAGRASARAAKGEPGWAGAPTRCPA